MAVRILLIHITIIDIHISVILYSEIDSKQNVLVIHPIHTCLDDVCILDNQCLLTIKVSMRATNLKQKHKSSIFEVKR